MTGKINQDNEPCELLAPAGGLSSAMAAFEYGADAIYLGFKKFSARSGAENFTYEEILSVIKQAKSYDKTKKVYVAINTLVKNDEIDELIKLLSFAEDAKFDGVILQDLGVFHLIKNYFSNLALHASTQMAVHNLEGALALKDLGFERVVLARELSLEEIEYITKNCGIETEVFIHGALCYGYSGLCFTSSFEVGLSANRGRCAYPCRDEYTRTGDKKKLGHIFSLKDFALEKRVLDLKKAGVASLKIEGRKKGSVYVAAVTDYYRKILDGNFQDDKLNYLRDNIKTIFSRKQTKLLFEKDKNFNAIDIEKSGHRGLFLSKIENVIKKGKKTLILFKTNRKIEKYDGLQIDIKGYGKPYGFSAQEFWEKTRNNNYKNVFFVLKNKKAIVTLPKNAPDINIGDKIYLSSSQKVKSDYLLSKKTFKEAFAKFYLDIDIKVSQNAFFVKLSCFGKYNFYYEKIYEDKFEKSNNLKAVENSIIKIFSQNTQTSFNIKNIKINNSEGFFIRASQIKSIRREVFEKAEEILKIKKKEFIDKVILSKENQENKLKNKPLKLIKLDNIEQFNKLSGKTKEKFGEIILNVQDFSKEDVLFILNEVGQKRIRLALPTICRKNQMPNICDKISDFISFGIKNWEISNVWGIKVLDLLENKSLLDITSNWHLHIMNNFAAKEMLSMGITRFTASLEDNDKNIESIESCYSDKMQKIVYATPFLFISDSCSIASTNKKCTSNCTIKSQETVTSSYDNNYKIVQKNCRNYVIDERAYYISKDLQDGNINILIDLSFNDESDVNHLVEDVLLRKKLEKTSNFNYKK